MHCGGNFTPPLAPPPSLLYSALRVLLIDFEETGGNDTGEGERKRERERDGGREGGREGEAATAAVADDVVVVFPLSPPVWLLSRCLGRRRRRRHSTTPTVLGRIPLRDLDSKICFRMPVDFKLPSNLLQFMV